MEAGELCLDAEGYVLTKSGKRDGRYTWPYGGYDI